MLPTATIWFVRGAELGVESWLDQLEEFNKKKKKGKRQMSSSLFSATDLGYGVGFRWKEGEFKERVKEEAANRKV